MLFLKLKENYRFIDLFSILSCCLKELNRGLLEVITGLVLATRAGIIITVHFKLKIEFITCVKGNLSINLFKNISIKIDFV